MSGVESRCGAIYCYKHVEKVDKKTCMLCQYYKKLLFTRKCHYPKKEKGHFLCQAFSLMQEKM
jgi:hypothetical protein